MSKLRAAQQANQLTFTFEQAALPERREISKSASAASKAFPFFPGVDGPVETRPTAKGWNFRESFPSPLPTAIAAGHFNGEEPSDQEIESIHYEQARELLAFLEEIDTYERARESGVNPRTGKRPRTTASRRKLEAELQQRPGELTAQFDDVVQAYADAFGADAAAAFSDWVRTIHQSGGSLPSVQSIDIELPAPTPLSSAVRKGVFGFDEHDDPVEPSADEVHEISLQYGERLAELFQELDEVNHKLLSARTGDRASLIQAKERLTCQVQGMLALYAEDFGETAARHLESWARHQNYDEQVSTGRREANHDSVDFSLFDPTGVQPDPPSQPCRGEVTLPPRPPEVPVVGSPSSEGTNNGGTMPTHSIINQNTQRPTRAEKLERLHESVEQALDRLAQALEAGKSEALKSWLKTMSRFHNYSFNNQLLIAWQRPDATHVAGFHAWKKFNRLVNKGEKGIMILAPVTRVVGAVEEQDDTGKSRQRPIRQIVNAKPVYVFDISQTHGDPLPELASVQGDPKGFTVKLRELIAEKGIELYYEERLSRGAQGRSEGGRIGIQSGLTAAEEFRTLVHELAHELLHRGERREQTTQRSRELEAESVAFVVSSAIGLDALSTSTDYIHLYRGNKEAFIESMQFIRNVSNEILERLAPSHG